MDIHWNGANGTEKRRDRESKTTNNQTNSIQWERGHSARLINSLCLLTKIYSTHTHTQHAMRVWGVWVFRVLFWCFPFTFHFEFFSLSIFCRFVFPSSSSSSFSIFSRSVFFCLFARSHSFSFSFLGYPFEKKGPYQVWMSVDLICIFFVWCMSVSKWMSEWNSVRACLFTSTIHIVLSMVPVCCVLCEQRMSIFF